MSFITRLLGIDKKNGAAMYRPNEIAMKNVMEEAKRKNMEAAAMLSTTADRQMRDAEMVRQVINDMLARIDKPKPKRTKRKAGQ